MNQNFIRQARKLQEQIAKIQEELEKETVTGTAGSGAVEIVLNGHGKLVRVKLSGEAVDPNDLETLEDLISIAFKDAQSKVAELSSSKMGPLTGSLPFSGF
jgi:nucleoid-associated protein EbfC